MDTVLIIEIFQKVFYFIIYPHWLVKFVGFVFIFLIILLIVNWITQNPKTKKHISTLWKGIYTHKKKILIPIVIVIIIMDVVLYFVPIKAPKPLQERVTDAEATIEKVQNEIVKVKDKTGLLLEKTQKLEDKVELLMRKRPRVVLREPSETDPYISVDDQCLSVFAEISDDYGIEENSINLMLDNEIIRDKPRIEKVSDTLLYVRYNIIRLFDCRPYYVTLSAKNILGAENTIIRRIIVYYPVREWTFTEKKEEKVSEHHEKIELTAEDNIIEWTSKKKWPGDIIIECWVKFMNFPPNFGIFFNSQYEVIFGDGNNDSVIFKGGLGGPKLAKCSRITGFPFQSEKVYHLKIKRVKGSVSIEIDGKLFVGGWGREKLDLTRSIYKEC